MGNKVTQSAATGLFQDLEQLTGKLLLKAIRDDEPTAIDEAIEAVKLECAKPICKQNNKATYNDMASIMVNYLTQPYDVGDGPVFKQTPLKYCELLKANKAKKRLIDRINDAQQKASFRETATVGIVTADRAQLAKERLKAFQQGREDKK